MWKRTNGCYYCWVHSVWIWKSIFSSTELSFSLLLLLAFLFAISVFFSVPVLFVVLWAVRTVVCFFPTAGVVHCHCVSVWFICDSLVGSLLKLETSGVAFLDFSAEVYALSGLVYPFCRLLRTVRRAMHNIQLSESLNLMIAGWRIDEARWATSLQSIHPSNWSACSPGCLRIYLLVGLP